MQVSYRKARRENAPRVIGVVNRVAAVEGCYQSLNSTEQPWTSEISPEALPIYG